MENNYIVTTHSNVSHGPKLMAWKDLHVAKFTFNSPFRLRLADEEIFIADEVVRVLPKRRMVAFGTWQGRQVVAKLFFDAQHAKRHMEKDIAGVKSLQNNKIPTPALFYNGMSEDRRIYVLIFERIHAAKNLDDIWLNRSSMEDVMPLLEAVTVELATQHVLGLLQHDLHLQNFLLTEKVIYTLDGAEIEIFNKTPLDKKNSMDNLALFLSQLGIGVESQQEKLFRHYVKARGWLIKSADIVEMFHLIKKWHLLRWKRYEKKIFRDSTEYECQRELKRTCLFDRHYVGQEFKKFLTDPEFAFHHATTKTLKAGRSATVVKVTLDGRDLVVKRYNMKNTWHRLRRCLRPSRAVACWRLSQKMKLFAIATAKPIAFIENRFFGLRGKSYFVTEYVSGWHVGEYFKHHHAAEKKQGIMVQRVVDLLKSVARLGVTHGDLKITNILLDAREQPVLIDLDGAAEHLTVSGLHKAWDAELTRFLANFRQQPQLELNFKQALNLS